MPRKTPLRPTLNSARRQDDTLAALPATLETRLVGALTVPIAQLTPDPDQPRRDHSGESLVALADSLTAHGVLQPLLVRAQGTLDDGRTRYMIVAGGRRYAAALLAGLAHLPVVVRDTEGAALRLMQLVENIQRQDLAPLEEARAFKELMDAEGLSAEALGARLHISGQKVRDRLVLLSNPKVSDAVQRGQIGPTIARDILRLADEPQAALLARLDAGASIDTTDVNAARARAAASGVTNPRRTGGGRSRTLPPPAALAPTIQTTFEPTPPPLLFVSPVTVLDRLTTTVGTLSIAAVLGVVRFGVDEGWTCAQLATALERVGLSGGDDVTP